ncbi:MAG: Baseplate J-like protein [Syntrophaceae bacterium PtaB.Bin095]|nr:MAG: Baseplate J-like protein [Syntrophaceae bacterium PtaB.Bin095]
MSFQRDFNDLLNALLTDWRNQFPEADLSPGSLIYMKSACLASALWGLYKYQEWITKQIFPDTADSAHLEHHAWVRGLSRRSGETDGELLARLLEYIRRPPAGGNKYDYQKWALEIDNVARAWCIPQGQGPGTVDVVIAADEAATGSEIPSSHALTGTTTAVAENKLVDGAADFTAEADGKPVRIGDIAVNDATGGQAVVTAVDSATQVTLDADIFTETGQTYTLKSLTAQVAEYIDDVRPVTASAVRVLSPTVTFQDVAMTVSGSVNKTAVASAIASLLNSLDPGETLYLSRLIAIAIQAGAANAVVSAPAADVSPGAWEMLRPGTITVS